MIITSDDNQGTVELKEFPNRMFKMKNLSLFNYFLGFEVASDVTSYYLSQAKYAFDLLSQVLLTNIKIVTIPIEPNVNSIPTNNTSLSDPSLYCKLVGRLVYLTVTCLGIAYTVHVLS